MSDFLVYLAGPITHADGTNWWDEARDTLEDLEIEVRDPFDKHDFGLTDDWVVIPEDGSVNEGTSHVVFDHEVVEGDKKAIDEADAILVGWDRTRRTRGTMSEITYAQDVAETPVVMWTRKTEDPQDLDTWPRYHADSITPELETAVHVIETLRSV
jgi:nucleoside 2-deoxyribosyltransferase